MSLTQPPHSWAGRAIWPNGILVRTLAAQDVPGMY